MFSSQVFESALSITMFVLRILVPLLSPVVLVRCFVSLKRGRRKEEPVVLLEDLASGLSIPVLYWENSIGRSKSCDIILPDSTCSRDHAVLYRRSSGWIITDTNSKAGTYVNDKKIKEATQIVPGDVITMGTSRFALRRVSEGTVIQTKKKIKQPKISNKKAPSPAGLLGLTNVIHLLLTVQCCFVGGEFSAMPFIPFALLLAMSWGLYLISRKLLGRVSFEIETFGFLLSGVGIMLLCAEDFSLIYVQMGSMLLGLCLFGFLIWFMGDLKRVMKARLWIAIAAIVLFAVNLVIGTEANGSKNWINLGPISIQPSEFIKIAFIFVGASTLDKLQTAKNLWGFLGFTAVCLGALMLMKDFGTACIFFITFIIIAFMRSGSIRTILLTVSGSALGVFLILRFKPYIAERFKAWRHVWEYADTTGYQQTKVLMYAASGGLFGVGLGNGYLKDIFAGDSDLVFGMLCEELGLVMGVIVVVAIAMLILFARNDATRSRSTFYSISACAAAGLLLFQTCLNIFGATDVLPLTGVTLPFISLGGSSMMSVWGLLAFIKASDERTYAVRRKSK